MKTLATLAFTVLFAGQATISEAVAQEGRSPSARPAGASLDVEAVLRATAEAGLPDAPVRRTVAEGEAKGAAEADIVRAALRTQGRLLLARELLEGTGDDASEEAISLGAEALLRGATGADLERIGDASEGRSVETSLKALLSLQRQGHGASEASSRIAGLLGAGESDVSIAALGGLNLSGGALGPLRGSGSGAGLGSLSGSATAAAGTGTSAATGASQIGAGVTGSIGVGIVP